MFADDEFFSLPFKWIVYIFSALPLGAFATCISIAVTFHFDSATETYCHVPNWLPSLSGVILDYVPERYIWRVCIALCIAPRFCVAILYKNFLVSSPLRPLACLKSSCFHFLCNFACMLNLTENAFLLLLSCISSTDNYVIHQIFFIIFAICSKCYMLLNVYLFHYSGRRRTSSMGEMSFQYKLLTLSISLIAIFFSVYFFHRHSAYCEPGVYTLFALSQYILVISNVFFHATAYYDFYGKKLLLISTSSFDYEPLLFSQSAKTT